MGTHFRGPLQYHKEGHVLNGAPLELVDKISTLQGYNGYASDFTLWEGPTGDVAAPGTGGWFATSVDGAGDGLESIDVRDSQEGGILRIQSNDADNDSTQIQQNGSVYRYQAAKELWFLTRLALEDANDGEVGFGLVIETATDLIGTDPTDGLFFNKTETATDFTFNVRKGDTETNQAMGLTLADDTFVILGFHVSNVGRILAYAGTDVNNLTVFNVVNTNAPDTQDLTIAYHVQTGSAATRYIDVDWVITASER